MSVGKSGKRDYLSRLQTLMVFLILKGTAKTKLAILAFLYCGEIVKILMACAWLKVDYGKNSFASHTDSIV